LFIHVGFQAYSDFSSHKTSTRSNELLEAHHGEWLDTRAKGMAGGIDPHMEAVGAINGGKDEGRESAGGG
jgi:hypothetical protein